jgi:hypothetical protein
VSSHLGGHNHRGSSKEAIGEEMRLKDRVLAEKSLSARLLRQHQVRFLLLSRSSLSLPVGSDDGLMYCVHQQLLLRLSLPLLSLHDVDSTRSTQADWPTASCATSSVEGPNLISCSNFLCRRLPSTAGNPNTSWNLQKLRMQQPSTCWMLRPLSRRCGWSYLRTSLTNTASSPLAGAGASKRTMMHVLPAEPAACALPRETSRKSVGQSNSTRSALSVDTNAQADGFSFMFPRSSIPCPNGATLSELYRSRRDDLWGALTKEQLKVRDRYLCAAQHKTGSTDALTMPNQEEVRAKEQVRQQDRSRKQKYAKELEKQIAAVQQRKSEEHGYLISKGFADDQSVFLQV